MEGHGSTRRALRPVRGCGAIFLWHLSTVPRPSTSEAKADASPFRYCRHQGPVPVARGPKSRADLGGRRGAGSLAQRRQILGALAAGARPRLRCLITTSRVQHRRRTAGPDRLDQERHPASRSTPRSRPADPAQGRPRLAHHPVHPSHPTGETPPQRQPHVPPAAILNRPTYSGIRGPPGAPLST